MRRTTLAWAIRIRSPEHRSWIGRYWWFSDNRQGRVAPQHEGYPTALFLTRRKARAELPGIREVWPRAVVERVRVTVSTG